MNGLIAYCGLDCAACEAYIATQADDLQAQERLLAKWRTEYNAPDMPLAAVVCDGCASTGRLGGYCAECEVRACAVEKGVATCAHCDEYACSKIQGFIDGAPQVKATLDEIRRGLGR
jgi:hypothetical protein